ncbi:V/A-type H+-transporting ATPase subunit I [Methanolobus vulcani]|jgi:V/A-type H+-transporting ATPase subunit I|uniref:A-type ATP synthase subunit I n=1 Tax=Methanolobus vulcani TaxID=38026 RepID=A0A7Z7AWU5_9EURY|nr:V-type ATP synthase subunit I [Methanolobus vulcani]MDK2825060.1 V/A-type H+/Na+-transporting ATPase subunit [Methanolobus sp.]SDF88168.1 V/A-type H+-transporting ATPase subunit I [Methanolobus vulcani]
MLDVKQMSRAVIVGHKSIFEETVDALHKANLFQIEDFNEDGSGLHIGRPFEKIDEVSKKLIKIRSIASLLGVKDVESKRKDAESSVLSNLDATLDKLDAELDVKTEQKSKLEAELKELDSLKKELLPFANISLDLDLYRGYEHLAVFAGNVKEDVGDAVSKITSAYEMFYDAKEGTVVLFVSKDKATEVADVLAGSGYRELRIPAASGVPSESLKGVISKESGLQEQIESIDAEIESLKDKYADFILASNEILSMEAQKSEAPLRVATSDSTFMIDGWVPAEDFSELERIVKEATNGRAFVSKQEMTKADEKIVPIEYNNSKIASPFQEIMDLYARPVYKELDPTFLIFISFPLFYGMILGDIGYALILLAMALGIKKMISSEAIKPLMNILIYCQISTLIFGVLYGEFLGFSLASLHTEHETISGLIPGFETINLFASPVGDEMITFPIHRTHLVMTMIIATALIGFIHINIGYLLGFINENKKHGMSAAIFEKGSWFVIEIGLLIAVLGYVAVLPSIATIAGVVVFLIGFVMLLKGEGIKGPIELPSLLSNSLSYTRIIAVGLSSIYIASTVNLIAFEMIWEPGTPVGVATIGAIIVFLFGHSLNTVLSIIAPGLHSLRLQYVEFFGKFYEGGGRKYDPFGYIRKYTEE